ncbi:MAG: hypothetical protein ACRYFU_21780 [Janthinobacterium lividum]
MKANPQAVTTCFGILLLGLGTPAVCPAQQDQPMGTVAVSDARVAGQVAVRGNQTQLFSNVNVTAFDHAAPVTLRRGGELLVCATSDFHLLHTAQGAALIFGLDRGAFELRSLNQTGDIIITPDVQLTPVTKGSYDLRVRVTREGDTCIENAGANAPVLNAADPFSSATYRILPGQHLMFVKGDLHKVVDHERSPCGCPQSTQVPQTLASGAGHPANPAQAAAAHPFPEAQSEGLAPTPPPANEASAGTASSQVTTTFGYGEGQTPPADMAAAPAVPPPAVPSPAPAPEESGFFHAVGHFFRRIFHSS